MSNVPLVTVCQLQNNSENSGSKYASDSVVFV